MSDTFKEESFQKTAAEEAPQQGRREIPKDHPYDPKSLKPLTKALWAASVAMGHALTSYRHISRLKSATISPDGKLGGKGYVMSVMDIRKRLFEACESLSAITDTLHDEVCAPHWKARLSQLDDNEVEDIERFVEESQGNIDNPESDAQEAEAEIESENDSKTKTANSSIPVGTLPGPRVEHLDRELDQFTEDLDPKEYPYGGPLDRGRQASSGIPDANTDPTRTEAWDFGLGYGAKGQGAGGYANPAAGGKGVYGPVSGLPDGSQGGSLKSLVDRFRKSVAKLPETSPVARSDYYKGGQEQVLTVWTEGPVAQSELPAALPAEGTLDLSMINTDYTYEDLSTPYVRYDYTNNDRKDPLYGYQEK